MKKEILNSSKEAGKIKVNLQNLSKDEDGTNSMIVYDTLYENEQLRIEEFIKKVGIRAYNAIETLEKRFTKINQPDKEDVTRVSDESVQFMSKPKYSPERAKEITLVAEMHGKLTTVFDAAMAKGSEENWKKVDATLTEIKKKLKDVIKD